MAKRAPYSTSASLLVLAALVAIGIALLFGRAIWTIRSSQWEFAQRSGLNLTTALEESISSTIRSFDQSLQGLATVVQNPQALALPEPLRQRVLFDDSLTMRGNGGIVVLNALGDVILDYNNPVPRKANFVDREYFRVFAKGGHTGLYIGAPIKGRLSGEYVLPLSRAWQRADGAFGGVVVGTIRLDYFNTLFSRLTLDDQSSINMMRADGTLITRFPFVETAVGKDLAGSTQFKAMQAARSGTVVGNATLDGIPRLYAYRRSTDYPLIVNVGQSVDQIVGRWLHSAWIIAGFAALLMFACLGLAVLFSRELRRRQQVSAQLADAERGLRTVLDNAPSAIAYWDAQLHNRFANGACLSIFGLPPDRASGMAMRDVLGPDLYPQIRAFVEKALLGGRQLHECSVVLAGDSVRHFMASWVPDVGVDARGNEVRGVFMQMTDITDRKRMEAELFDDKERMRLTLQSIGDGVICTDAEGHITYINPMAERMTGWQAFDAAHRDIDDVCRLLRASDIAGHGELVATTPLRTALEQHGTVGPTRGVVLQRLDGTRFDVEETASAITDRHGEVTGAVMVLRDVTDSVAVAQRMAHLAQYDALTDLPNRVLLLDRARQGLAQARRQDKLLAVVYLDLDGFKEVNDRLGHEAGDELLVQIAQRLLASTRATDTVSRKGGDEFVVLLTGIPSTEELAPLARKLLAVCATPFRLGAHDVAVGLSGGVAIYPLQGDTFEGLSRQADAAMYAAKRAGRGQVFLHAEQGDYTVLAQAGS